MVWQCYLMRVIWDRYFVCMIRDINTMRMVWNTDVVAMVWNINAKIMAMIRDIDVMTMVSRATCCWDILSVQAFYQKPITIIRCLIDTLFELIDTAVVISSIFKHSVIMISTCTRCLGTATTTTSS